MNSSSRQRTPAEDLQWAAYHAWHDKAAQLRNAVGQEHSSPAAYEPEHNWWRSTMPKMRLLCPRGHRLVTVEEGATATGLLQPVRSELDGRSESGKAVVFEGALPGPGTSSLRTDWRFTCSVQGCQKKTLGIHCEQHAKTPVDLIHREMGCIRWNFRCPKCSYNGTWTGARLFMVYAVGAYLGLSEIQLPS